MSLSKEHSRDEADSVNWPHMETNWQAQHQETPHSVSKKMDNSRPQSCPGNNHVRSKSLEWLQENLSGMDSKVSAMLKIIEEDAGSSPQRADTYYKRRPELVSLVEEFYRIYRDLMERHTNLTMELHQSTAPTLQAHYTGASIHEPPADATLKQGMVNGFDMSSHSSYPVPGALEYDDGSHSEFSAKSSKRQVGEEEGSSQITRPKFDDGRLELQPFASGSEEQQACWQQNLNRNFEASETDVLKRMEVVRVLEEEKKALEVKLDEVEAKLKGLQFPEVGFSSLENKNNCSQEENMAMESLLEKTDLEVKELCGLKSARSLQKGSEEEMTKFKHMQNEHVALTADQDINSTDAFKQRNAVVEQAEGKEALQMNMRLEEKLRILETEILERSKLVEKLRADMEELENAKENAVTKCELSEEECRALKASEAGMKALLEAKLAESLSLKDDNLALEDEVERVRRQAEEETQKLAECLSQAVQKHMDGEKAAMEAKDEFNRELLEFSASVETLQQSLLAKDMEISKLHEDLINSADARSESEQRFKDEIRHLQTEESRWRNEVSANSDLMAEKVATLRKENAALHEDLSVKLELLLKLQKDVESLTEERSSLSEALQAMAAEMQEYKNDLEFFKEEVIPSLEESIGELQGEVTGLLISNERHVVEIDSLRTQVTDANSERLLLHDENEKLKVELMFSVEMLRHVDGVLLTVKMESLKLGDKLGLLEQYSQEQERSHARVLDEKEDLSRGLLGITEERNGLKAEVQRMETLLGEVEQLSGELRAARQASMSVNMAESVDDTAASGNSGQAAKDGHTEEPHPSHGLLVEMLKEEILHLQEEISRLRSKEDKARDIRGVASDEASSLRKNSTSSSSSSILSVEDSTHAMLDDMRKLQEENSNMAEEIESLKSQSHKAWMENSDLQARVASLHEENVQAFSEVISCKEDVARLEAECLSWKTNNGHLGLEVSSCKARAERFGEECDLLQKKNGELEGVLKSLADERSKVEETMCMLEGVITELERNNRRLQAETESGSMEMEKLRSTTSSMHGDASELIDQMKTKMMSVLEEVKLMIEECREDLGDEGILQIMKGMELPFMSPSADKQHKIIQSTDHRDKQEGMTELREQNRLLLSELQARAEETSILLQFVVFIRKIFISVLGGEHTCHVDASKFDGEGQGDSAEKTTSACVEHHNLFTFADEKLEHELLELKEGRKRLKDELEMRSAEAQKMESELEKLQLLLEQKERGKGHEHAEGEGERRKSLRAQESLKELPEILAQHQQQIGSMLEELMFGDEQQDRVSAAMASMESASSMEKWDEEQVNLLRRELESLRGLSRRQIVELRTISQDLQSMGSIIKAAHDQLLKGLQRGEEEIESMADLRTLNSNTLIDLRAQDNRVSVDSAQLLLSPISPRIIGDQEDSLAAHQSSDMATIGARFPLKPRNFGFTWFLLLFSPDRKATGTLARNRSHKPWMGRKPARSSSESAAAAMVERGRRKTAGCWACVSNGGRIDSFDQR